MNRSSGLIYFTILLLILLPTPAGKFILDLAGGIFLISLFIPLFLAGIGWIGWKIIRSNMNTCSNCGASYQSNLYQCPLCGSSQVKEVSLEKTNNSNIPASSATIDVTAEDSD